MNILRASLLTAISSGAKLVSAFVVMKYIAVISGPSGVAQLGQFISFISVLIVFAGGGINQGMIKYLAEYKNDFNEKIKLINSGFAYVCITSVVTSLVIFYFSKEISIYIFGDNQYESLIIIASIIQFLIVLNNLFIALLNGLMEVKKIAIIYIIGAGFSCSATFVLGFFFRFYGGLLAVILGQAFLFFVTLRLLIKSKMFSYRFFIPAFDKFKTINLSKFSIMTLTSALMLPIAQLVLRNYLSAEFGWEEVGYWQAVSHVSDAYLLFITMVISVYYLPVLSGTNDKALISREVGKAFVFIVPLVSFLAFIIYILRELITVSLFSSEFYPANYLYAPQLIGDVIKISSFLFSYIMLAKAMTKMYIFSEIFFSMSYVFLAIVFSKMYGLIGVMYAFIVNYFLYFLFTFSIYQRYMNNKL